MKTLFALTLLSFFLSSAAWAEGKKVAVVKLLKGEADVLTLGKTLKLKTDDWVEDGSVVKTQDKSFVKLVFVDKSQMNIGPNSEMKIEKFDGKDSGVIDLVKGKIRSQVTKDYLQIQDKDKSKLFIKTPNAVMGIRGTDFMISTNGKNTAAVLFEGEVVFNRLDARNVTSSQKLEDIVDRGVRMFPGEFSVVDANRSQPTVPSLLNVKQKEALEKNENFESERKPSNNEETASTKSVVPAGLTGDVTANSADVLKNEVAQVAQVDPSGIPELASGKSKDANGFVDGEKVKPTAGSFLHIDSGVIIPPAADSVLDPVTNTYIPSANSGTVAEDGNFVPPKNVEITSDGKILVAVADSSGQTKVVEVPPPPPVKPEAPVVTTVTTTTLAPSPVLAPAPAPTAPKNDILTSSGATSGSLLGTTTTTTNTTTTNELRLVNQVINQNNGTATTIRVKPQ